MQSVTLSTEGFKHRFVTFGSSGPQSRILVFVKCNRAKTNPATGTCDRGTAAPISAKHPIMYILYNGTHKAKKTVE